MKSLAELIWFQAPQVPADDLGWLSNLLQSSVLVSSSVAVGLRMGFISGYW